MLTNPLIQGQAKPIWNQIFDPRKPTVSVLDMDKRISSKNIDKTKPCSVIKTGKSLETLHYEAEGHYVKYYRYMNMTIYDPRERFDISCHDELFRGYTLSNSKYYNEINSFFGFTPEDRTILLPFEVIHPNREHNEILLATMTLMEEFAQSLAGEAHLFLCKFYSEKQEYYRVIPSLRDDGLLFPEGILAPECIKVIDKIGE